MTNRRRSWVNVGLLYRREVRRFFLRQGIPFTEDKTWTESFFVYHGTEQEIAAITRWVQKINLD